MSKITIISTSGRRNSNSYLCCEKIAQGAKENHHDVEIIEASSLTINPCKGCGACEKTGHCYQKDDFYILKDKIQSSDIVLFASPIYFFNMSGLLKTILDRSNCYIREVKFHKVGLVLASAAPIEAANELAEKGFEYFIHDMKNVEYVGTFKANGVEKQGEVLNSPILDKAFEFGKNL